MNKKFLLGVLAALSLATVGIISVGTKSVSNVKIARAISPTVSHSTTFTYEDISYFENEYGFCISTVSETTTAGNTFSSYDITMEDYSTYGPSHGDSNNQYLYKINQLGYPYYIDNDSSYITIEFKMKIDVPFGVTKAVVNYTTFYDASGNRNLDTTSKTTKEESFDDYELDEQGLEFDYFFEFKFANKYQYQVTINYIEFTYSCTY